jgi:DNA sulfur modification protein DndD
LEGETSDFDDYRIALTKQIAKQEIQENPDIMLPEGSPDAPSLKRMLEHQWCEVCNREAPRGSEPWLHIKKVMERPKKPMRVSDSFMQFYAILS